ncbi:MAG: tRNA (N(6)-L-threonylcarbamoyladenosine(37)-C(2))-methylthiotransferase MtaB [Bacteroidota bacterium]
MSVQTVAFYTLGCKLNFSETSTIGRQFSNAGFQKVDFHQASDIYVINTCSVTAEANKKCRKIIKQALKRNPQAFIVVTGCYAQLKPKEIVEIPGVDIVVGAGDKFRITELVDSFTKTDNPCIFNGDIKEVDSFTDAYSLGDRTRTFLKIQDGCDYKCTFCTIPLARGKSRSDTLERILANAQKIGESGIKEIVLTGVNIGDYGKGIEDPRTFLDVIKALDEVESIERFRISSIEPNLCHDDIIQFVAQSKRFMPHFHMPLQSGNDELLGKMRRRYKRELYTERVTKIKSLMPHACIGVDVIVGFPGETDAHFEDTYQFLTDLDISYLHVFTYSEREHTLAVTMPGVVPVKVRHQRNQRLRMLSEKKKHYFYSQYAGSTRPVLYEGKEENGSIHGFSDNYIKVVRMFDEKLVNQILPTEMAHFNAKGMMEIVNLEPVELR